MALVAGIPVALCLSVVCCGTSSLSSDILADDWRWMYACGVLSSAAFALLIYDRRRMKTENIKNEINNIRKHKLGLTSINTNQVFDILMKYYKKIVINAPRNIMGYTIDIALARI